MLRNYASHWLKSRQLKGGFAPHQGFAPGPHWGQSPQTPKEARASALAIMCSRTFSLEKALLLIDLWRVTSCDIIMNKRTVYMEGFELYLSKTI